MLVCKFFPWHANDYFELLFQVTKLDLKEGRSPCKVNNNNNNDNNNNNNNNNFIS